MNFSLVELAQVILADIFLSGDNAIIIGMAAAGLSEKFRKRVIFWGLALAAGFRIIFAAIASFLIQIPGILIFGGLLLAFVCWRFFKEIRHAGQKTDPEIKSNLSEKLTEKQQFSQALFTIAVADISSKRRYGIISVWTRFSYSTDGVFCNYYNACNDEVPMAFVDRTYFPGLSNHKDAR